MKIQASSTLTRKFLKILSLQILISCVNTANTPLSDLPTTSNVKCQELLGSSATIEIERALLFSPDSPQLSIAGVMRNNDRANFVVPVTEAFYRKGYQPKSFGSDAVTLGGYRKQDKEFVILGQNLTQTIEVRDLQSNIVVQSSSEMELDFRATKTQQFGNSIWLYGPKVASDKAWDESEYGLYQVSGIGDNSNSLATKRQTKSNFDSKSKFHATPSTDKHTTSRAYVLELSKDKNGAKRFMLNHSDGRKQVLVDFPVRMDIESFDIITDGSDIWIAAVDGDSMIGAATLRVARYTLKTSSANLIAITEQSLKNLHVSEPVFIAPGDILLPQWLDETSTIARYQFDGTKINLASSLGSITNGLRVVSTLKNSSNRTWIVTRYRDKQGLKHGLCSFE